MGRQGQLVLVEGRTRIQCMQVRPVTKLAPTGVLMLILTHYCFKFVQVWQTVDQH